MDPMESMSVGSGRMPNNFNADDAQNMEDVGFFAQRCTHASELALTG